MCLECLQANLGRLAVHAESSYCQANKKVVQTSYLLS